MAELTDFGKHRIAELWRELDMDNTIIAKQVTDEDLGPLQMEVQELRKRMESLHLTVDRLERKFRLVLRSVPDEPSPDGPVPRLMQAPLTEMLSDLNRSLGALDLRLNDMNTRCEL